MKQCWSQEACCICCPSQNPSGFWFETGREKEEERGGYKKLGETVKLTLII